MIVQGSWIMNKYDTNPPNTSRFFGEILQKVPVTMFASTLIPLKNGWDMVAFNDPCLNWWTFDVPNSPWATWLPAPKSPRRKYCANGAATRASIVTPKWLFAPPCVRAPNGEWDCVLDMDAKRKGIFAIWMNECEKNKEKHQTSKLPETKKILKEQVFPV